MEENKNKWWNRNREKIEQFMRVYIIIVGLIMGFGFLLLGMIRINMIGVIESAF